MHTEVERSLQQWVVEVDAIFLTLVRIAEYFGSEADCANLAKSLVVPRAWHHALSELLAGESDQLLERGSVEDDGHRFTCSHELASMINPLLVVVAEPGAEFVHLARRLEEDPIKTQLLRGFGWFSVELVTRVCSVVWKAYPDLMPGGMTLPLS